MGHKQRVILCVYKIVTTNLNPRPDLFAKIKVKVCSKTYISGMKKLIEKQKAAYQEKDFVSFFEKRFDKLEKKIDVTQTIIEEMKNQENYPSLTTKAQQKKALLESSNRRKKTIFPEFSKILRDKKIEGD